MTCMLSIMRIGKTSADMPASSPILQDVLAMAKVHNIM